MPMDLSNDQHDKILKSLQCKPSQQYLASGSVASEVMDPKRQPTTFLSQYNS